MKETEIAYIAGLFDGEGSASVLYPKASKNGKRYKKLVARIAQCDRTVLDWVAELTGYGTVHEKSDKRDRAKTWTLCHDYQVAYKNARLFLTLIEPYLIVKRDHVTSLLDENGREY